MGLRRFTALCAAAVVLQFATAASAGEKLYIQSSDEIHIIDAHSFRPVATIPIGEHTDDIVGAPDGRTAYGNAAIANGNPLGISDMGRVFAIDTATNKIIWSRGLDGHPQHLTVSKDGARLYAPALNSNYITVYDTTTGRVVDRWFATPGHHGTELSADGRRLYVGNVFSGKIYVYDTGSGDVVRTYDTGRPVRPFKMDAAEAKIYYQLSYLQGFEVRDIATGKVTRVMDFDTPKVDPANPTLSHGIAISPDGKWLIALGTFGKFARVYSMPDLKLVGQVAVGDDANWIRVRADSKVAFISNRGSGTVSAIDISTVKELARFPAGKHPGRFDIVDVPEPRAGAAQ